MTAKKQDVMNHDPLADLARPDPEEGTLPETVSADSEQPAPTRDETPEPATAERVLELGSCLTIAEVGEVSQQLVGVFDTGTTLVLEGGEIEQIDGAGVQLLAGLMKEAVAQQAAVEWAGSSSTLREAVAQLGLAELLQLGVEA